MARFYFDFLSPYSHLASQRLAAHPELADAEPIPVVLGTILSHYDAQGPGEVPARRRAGLRDVLLLAAHHGLPFRGPPKHPFNSVPALRLVGALAPETRLAFVRAAFRAAWAEGRDLSDFAVLRDCLSEVGVSDVDPEEAATDRARRAELKAQTRAFVDAGGVGVPTFEVQGVMFFGQDRMDLACRYARGELAFDPEVLERLLGRPQPERIR